MMHSHNSPLKASRMARRRRLVLLLKSGGVLIVLAGLLYATHWLSYRSFWNIASVQVAGAHSMAMDDVQAIVARDIGGAYGLVLSKSNQFIYPRREISDDIEAAFPQVAAVSLAVSGHALAVSLTERQAHSWWCAAPMAGFASTFPDSVTALATDACYQMDDQGYIFMPVSTSSTPLFTFYGRLATTSNPIGSSFLNADVFGKLTGLISTLNTRGLASNALIDRPDGVDELYLAQGGLIVFDDTQDFNEVADDVAALQKSTSIFNGAKALAYADVRLGNKAFYKFADAKTASLAASSTLHTTATSTAGQ